MEGGGGKYGTEPEFVFSDVHSIFLGDSFPVKIPKNTAPNPSRGFAWCMYSHKMAWSHPRTGADGVIIEKRTCQDCVTQLWPFFFFFCPERQRANVHACEQTNSHRTQSFQEDLTLKPTASSSLWTNELRFNVTGTESVTPTQGQVGGLITASLMASLCPLLWDVLFLPHRWNDDGPPAPLLLYLFFFYFFKFRAGGVLESSSVFVQTGVAHLWAFGCLSWWLHHCHRKWCQIGVWLWDFPLAASASGVRRWSITTARVILEDYNESAVCSQRLDAQI